MFLFLNAQHHTHSSPKFCSLKIYNNSQKCILSCNCAYIVYMKLMCLLNRNVTICIVDSNDIMTHDFHSITSVKMCIW